MQPKQGRPQNTALQIEAAREKIAGHAMALFRQEGFASVSIRRLAKEVGCAPMTIYAHFAGKTDILRYLWADVLSDVFAEIQTAVEKHGAPHDRLTAAVNVFVQYWLNHPDHFRLVFMSADLGRTDVATFMKDGETQKHFKRIADLVTEVVPNAEDIGARTDALVCGMIGIALCLNTVVDHPWSAADAMTGSLLRGVTA